MDLSKLPRLSESSKSPPAQSAAPNSAPEPPGTDPQPMPAPPRMFAEAWISIGIGIILLLACPNTWKYYLNVNFTNTYVDAQGNSLAYTHSVFYWGDLVVTGFAVALILEGIVLALSRHPAMIILALLVTVMATVGNLADVAAMYPTYGLQLIPALAVLFGGFMVISEWRLLQQVRASHPR